MKIDDEAFFKKLLATFKVEASERIQKISLSLLELEKSKSQDQDASVVELIFREVHSLKSASRAVNLLDVEKICQKLESEFSAWKQNKKKPNESQFDLLHKLNSKIEKLISDPEINTAAFQKETEALLNKLDAMQVENKNNREENKMSSDDILEEAVYEERTVNQFEKNTHLEEKTVRIAASKLDTLLIQSEEMLAAKLSFQKRHDELNEIKNDLQLFRKHYSKILEEKSIRQNPNLPNVYSQNRSTDVNDKEVDKTFKVENLLKHILSRMDVLSSHFEQNLRSFGLGIDNLLEDSKKMMLLPFSTILNGLPITVRDVSQSVGKKVNFDYSGAELEIDKRILEEMKDVLMHLVRNAIDHGIEDKEKRLALNKSETGRLNIDIKHMTGNEIQLEINDDGQGIDLEKVKKSALKHGIITNEEMVNLSCEDALMLIFQSGISTQEKVTELSGRGLGMSIIREKIEKVGGKISVHSREKLGTTIKIALPLTLATFKGILVKISKENFIVPTSNLEKIITVSVTDIKKIENRETILYGNQVISLFWLADILGLDRKPQAEDKWLALILSSTDRVMAFVVDEIVNESEILVKQFSRPLVKVKNIAAAAILESGKPIPILNTLDLLENTPHLIQIKTPSLENEEVLDKNKRILLAEDSITTRMLIKNILELDNFQVTTAVDGLEAWEKLKENDYELVVSDIEMPRMDGFELTKRIRKDERLGNIPIVLITSLETQQDREKGIDLGANAYVLKSSFDSKHLLDIVNKLRR